MSWLEGKLSPRSRAKESGGKLGISISDCAMDGVDTKDEEFEWAPKAVPSRSSARANLMETSSSTL